MDTVREAFKMLLSKKIIFILLILQLSMAFYSIIEWILIKNNNVEFKRNITNSIDINNLYINPKQVLPSEKAINSSINKIDELMNFIKSNPYVEDFGNYVPYMFRIVEKDKNLDYDKLNNKLNFFYNGKYSESKLCIECIAINENSYNFFNIPIEQGKGLSSADFSKKNSEEKGVLLGAGFKEFYSMNDSIYLNNSQKYRVKGFLPEKYKFLGSTGETVEDLRETDMLIIYPLSLEEESDNIMRYLCFGSTIIKPKNKDASSKVMKDINAKAKELNIDIDCKEIYKVVEDDISYMNENIFHILALAIIIIIFSSISIIFTMVNYISRRKREFGIRFACGGSMKKVINLVVVENILLFLISSTLSILIYYKKYNMKGYTNSTSVFPRGFKISIPVIILYFIFAFITCIITCVLPILKMRKLSPKDLIGGVE